MPKSTIIWRISDMKIKNDSIYALGEPCSRGRKFASYVLDFLTSVILAVILFMLAEFIMNNTSLMKGYREDVSGSYTALIREIEKTGIGEADDEENLLSLSTLEENYMKGIVFRTLKENNVSGISEETYKDVKEIDATNDHAYSYYVTFKATHLSDYKEESRVASGWNYYTGQLFKDSDASYFILKENEYPLLTLDTAKAIDNYFRDASYSIGSKCYNSVLSSYSLLLEAGTKDVQNNYAPYESLFATYQIVLKRLYIVRDLELLICYALTLLIVYFLIPLLFRNGQTLSMKILKIGATDKRGGNPAWYQLLIKYGVNLIEYFLIIPVVALLFYGPDALDLIGSELFWNISYLSLGAFSLIFMILSFALTFLMRNTKQSISEYLSGMIVKDSEVYVMEDIPLEGADDARPNL